MSAALDEHDELETALPLIKGLTRLHDWVAVFQQDGKVLWLSDGLASACGGGRRFKGQHWLDCVAVAEEREALLGALETEGRISNRPVHLREASGAQLPVTVSAARVSHQCAIVVAIFRHTETRAKEAEATFRYLAAVLDSSPDGVVVIDRSRFITYANPAMEEITGWNLGELIDRPLAVFLRAQEDLARIANALGEQPKVRDIELSVRKRDGTPLSVSVSVSRVALEDGTPVGAVAYVQDITERKRFELDLERKNQELEHYVNTVSHDLRSPLVSVLGFSRLLREDFAEQLGEKGTHFVKRIEEAGRSMEALIHDLLELSRIEGTEIRNEHVDPRDVLLQLQAELKPRLDEVGVSLILPPDPPMVPCERTRLYQLFANLINNALDHMGTVTDPEIRVEVTHDPESVGLHVSDNGSGVDPKNHGRIFEIFESIGSGAATSGRTGMGLAIVKKIVEDRGGRVWVESALGQGATFHVELPQA